MPTQSLKVIIAGPPESGKRTLIGSVSEIAVLPTRREISVDSGDPADRVAVDMVFGRVTVAEDIVLYLFGTTGDERASFVWDTLADNLLGFVVLVDARSLSALNEARTTVAYLSARPEVPFVVAVNRLSADDSASIERLRAELGVAGDVPVLSLDARDRRSALAVFGSLTQEALRRIG